MNVFFGTTTAQLEEYKKYYISIREYLIQSDCVILFDWLDDAISFVKKSPKAKRNIKKIYQQVVEAIDKADAVVIEYTVPNFSSSHQINYAIYRRKPTLVLRLKRDNTFADSYIDALESPYLFVKDYNLRTYRQIIDEFLDYSGIDKGLKRYNIVLDRMHKYYLDWASAKYKISRSEVIRDALEGKMKEDNEFRKYLK